MHQGTEILIAEDSPTQAAQLQYILERQDYRVLVAGNGRQALAMLREREAKPALVISDITMPEMDGYELCREIKLDERLSDISVMLLTSLTDPHDIVRGLECGAETFLSKPYDEKLLLARVLYILINRKTLQSNRTEVFLGGQRLMVTPERQQILDLLLSTYESAMQKNLELQRVQDELKALNEDLEERVEARTSELVREITERKQVEEALLSSEKAFSELVNSLPLAAYVCDSSGTIESYNPRAEELWGRAPKLRDVEDRYCGSYKIFEPNGAYLPHELCPMAQALRTGTPVANEEIVVERPDGSRRTAMVNILPRKDEQGNLTGAINCLTDITEHEQAKVALRQTEEQLRQSQKLEAVGQLAGGVAHDFNNLLTVIGGYTNLLLKSLTDHEQRQKVEEVKKAGERAAALTRQLLAFSRKQVLQPVVLNLNNVIPETDKMLRRLLGEDIDILTVMNPELWHVKADAGQVEQVLMNLAINARDAMPKGGKLTIQTANVYLDAAYAHQHVAVQPGHYVMLAVSDTGCGMDAETQAHIFEPFFTTKETGKGTGLGLSMVYGIVKQSGGNIWVYSEQGLGTTFKIYLPRICETPAEKEACVVNEKIQRGVETVLVLEDEEAVRLLMQDILEMNGYRVLVAASGREALEISEHEPELIDLMITDVVMPQMGGPEVAALLTPMRPEMKVLFMSGYTDEAIVHHGVLDAGIAFLEKPFTPDAVARKVREMLDAQPVKRRMGDSYESLCSDVAQAQEA